MRLAPAAAWTVIALMLFGAAEVFSFAALSLTPPLQALTYHEPEIGAEEWRANLEDRDPLLGWPGRRWLDAHADDRGARTSPANAAFGDAPPCVSLYGDSFTYADEVADAEAWGDVMAWRLGCPVLNFGVGGYGVDQALMRLEQRLEAGAAVGEVMVLGVYPDDLNRNMNQWRYLLQGEPALSFKPVFTPAGDGLEPVAPFAGDLDALRALVAAPAAHLPHERYLPGGDGLKRRVRAGFPYSLTLVRAALRLAGSIRGFDTAGRSNLINQPDYYDTRRGPSDEKRALQRLIAARYAQICQIHGKTCFYMFIPEAEQIFQIERYGRHDLDWLLQDLPEPLIPLDATTIFSDLDDICASLTRDEQCQGHYNADGNRRLADFVSDAILLVGDVEQR